MMYLQSLVICHLFFPDQAPFLIEKLKKIREAKFIFNISDSLFNLNYNDILEKSFPGCKVINIPNKGRDIGGKLFALDLALRLGIESDIVLFIHDKKSLHTGSDLWRDELFKIIEPRYFDKAKRLFLKFPKIGIVCASGYIQNEYDRKKKVFNTNSNLKIQQTLKKFSIVTSDFNFVAGNIFWVRYDVLKRFFLQRKISEIRIELEYGNALDFYSGTYIHSWERIMSWIATAENYTIYGI